MTEQSDLERLNFFRGLFTTAGDWQVEQAYHREKLALHNQWLHNLPGIVRSVGDELRVEPAGGLKVRVLPGAALDSLGRGIRLLESRTLDLEHDLDPGEGDVAVTARAAAAAEAAPATEPAVATRAAVATEATRVVYLFLEYAEKKTDFRENPQQPLFSQHARIAESQRLGATLSTPDNQTRLELARIRLQTGATEILDPEDPDHPQDNEIDRRHMLWTGPLDGAEQMAHETLQYLIQVMQRTRHSFAALDSSLPVPSASDVRHGALTVEMLARTGCMHAGRLLHAMLPLSAVERDVGQELGTRYGNILDPTSEYHRYQVAVQELEAALQQGRELGILNAQDAVSEAARELSELIIESPIADAGRDQSLTTFDKEMTVTLDATGSQARGGREIVRYQWVKE